MKQIFYFGFFKNSPLMMIILLLLLILSILCIILFTIKVLKDNKK